MKNLSCLEIVNVFCNMTGATFNESQKDALVRLMEQVYESGVKSEEPKCDGCKTLDPTEGANENL